MVCPHCGLGGTASGELFEKKVRCPECQKIFRITNDVIVDLPPEAGGGVIEQSLIGDDLDLPGESELDDIPLDSENEQDEEPSDVFVQEKLLEEPETSELAEVEEEPEEQQIVMESQPPNQCTICGFFFSDEFINVVGEKSICPACAG